MKRLGIFFALLASVTAGSCQTVTTNWVTAAPNYREVTGKLYNIEKSTNWIMIWGECQQTLTNGIIIRTSESPEQNYATRTGNPVGPVYYPGFPYESLIYLKNYPTNLPTAWGSKVNIRVLWVGINTLQNGERLQTYDCGTPHVVAVLKTNFPADKNTITNR